MACAQSTRRRPWIAIDRGSIRAGPCRNARAKSPSPRAQIGEEITSVVVTREKRRLFLDSCGASERPVLPSIAGYRKPRQPLGEPLRFHALAVSRDARPEWVVPDAQVEQVVEPVWRHGGNRILFV